VPDAGGAAPETAIYYVPRITQTVIPATRRLLDAFRAAGRPVAFTRHGPLLPDGSDMIERRRRRDVDAVANTEMPALWHKGTFEHEIVAGLAPLPGELVLDKNTSSAFNSTGIEWLLRNMACNCSSSPAWRPTCASRRPRAMRPTAAFDVIVVEDATATYFERHHEAALSGFARVFGQVWESGRVLEALRVTSSASTPTGA